MTRSSKSAMPPEDRPPALEWIVAALGFSLVAGTVGFLAWRTATRESASPRLVVEVGESRPVEGGYLVPFILHNKGEGNAAGVMVEGRLVSAKDGEEASSVTVDFAPLRSRTEGGLLFTSDPAGGDLTVRPLGYTIP